MYARTIIYKIYAVILLVGAILGTVSSLSFALFSFGDLFAFLPSSITTIINVLKFISVIIALLSFFFTYVEFSSMFALCDMIDYEKSNSTQPMIKRGFIFSGKVYRTFGTVIFSISFLVTVIACLVIIISSSVEHSTFICVPLIPILVYVFPLIFTYICYYVKFKSIGDLLDLTTANTVTSVNIMALKENKPSLLRGYCTFLYVLDIIQVIAFIILMFIVFGTICDAVGTGYALVVVVILSVVEIINFISIGIVGCFFDNIAKMVEHYQIKYKVLGKEEK